MGVALMICFNIYMYLPTFFYQDFELEWACHIPVKATPTSLEIRIPTHIPSIALTGRGAKLPVVPGSANAAHAHGQPQQHGNPAHGVHAQPQQHGPNTAHGVHAQSQQHGPNTAGGVSSFFGSITGRRKLPDRGTAQSRSLDYPGGPTLETVVEAGRGVRKLPLQPGGATNLGMEKLDTKHTDIYPFTFDEIDYLVVMVQAFIFFKKGLFILQSIFTRKDPTHVNNHLLFKLHA